MSRSFIRRLSGARWCSLISWWQLAIPNAAPANSSSPNTVKKMRPCRSNVALRKANTARAPSPAKRTETSSTVRKKGIALGPMISSTFESTITKPITTPIVAKKPMTCERTQRRVSASSSAGVSSIGSVFIDAVVLKSQGKRRFIVLPGRSPVNCRRDSSIQACVPQPQGVGDDGDRAQAHRQGGKGRRQRQPEDGIQGAGRDRDADHVVDERQKQVLTHVVHDRAAHQQRANA